MLSGEACPENMDSDIKKMENMETESLSPLDPACSHIVSGEDGYTGPEEECSEDDDSDEDYASIQKPAFLVEGEPNFDSGPPEDGLEYLRRVRQILSLSLYFFSIDSFSLKSKSRLIPEH